MQIVTELNLDVFCWWFLRRIESHFSPPFCWEYFWGLFQPLWPVATPSFWLESIMASQPILPPPDVACLILSGSLTIGFGQLNGPVNFRFLHPKSRLMRNFPKGSMVLTFFCSGSIWQHNFQTSWNQTLLKQNLWEPQTTYESCGFSQQVARWETGKTFTTTKIHEKNPNGTSSPGSPRAGKATPGGWLWCGMFFCWGFNCQNRCDVLQLHSNWPFDFT